ncbi:MAG: ion channel [Rhizomicrobium sp.]|nr:ion channel [Rhizomicrobium sp.]
MVNLLPEQFRKRFRRKKREHVSLWRAPPGRRLAIIKGQDRSRWTDFYHAILVMPWPLFLLMLAAFFVALNCAFALLYMVDPNGIEHAEPGNFWDAFRFSVHTIASIGYGVLTPKGTYVNVVVIIEAFVGVLNVALITGAVFSRFSRPTARILFSDIAVITNFDGEPMLMFRAANQRGNQILDANIAVNFAWQQTTREGHTMRRFEELSLVRARSSLFALSWTVMHRLDETSPLYGHTSESLKAVQGEIVAMLSGTDETLAAVIFARHSYRPHEILWRHRFIDILSRQADGQIVVELTHFHEAVPDGSADEA